MSNEPVVSIITAFLNAGKYITETIESVLSQTFTNWELLLIDDGSTDNSTEIAKEYASKIPGKIRYFEHEKHLNLGKSISRNIGIHNARGRFIAFLDADDIFLPFKLERQLQLLNKYPDAAMVFGVTEYWYSWDSNSVKKDYTPELGLNPGQYNPPELAIFFLRKSQFTPCICSFLVHKNILININGFNESIQDLFEDQILIYKICLTENVYAENGCNEKYRQHSESTSALAIQNKIYHPVLPNISRLKFLEWLQNYINERMINNRTLNMLLQREIKIFQFPAFYSIYLPLKNIMRKVRMRFKVL